MAYTKDIRSINSESDVWKKIFNDLREYRVMNQMALYLDAGVDRYYNPNTAFLKHYDYLKLAQLLARVLIEKQGLSVAIISLGCGSCETDKVLLEHLQEMGYNFSFFGVDSSLRMIRKANDVLHSATFDTHLICANFGAFDFQEELDEIIGHYDVKIYTLFGSTMGNLDQGYIGDTLRDILLPDDYLLLDIGGFKTITYLNKLQLFNRYSEYIDSPYEAEFFLGPLKDFGVPQDIGKLILDIETDHATQAEVFIFKFEIKKSIELTLRKKTVGLTANEQIDVCRILVYDFNELIKFLKKKKFEFKDQLHGEYNNQLLFQRK